MKKHRVRLNDAFQENPLFAIGCGVFTPILLIGYSSLTMGLHSNIFGFIDHISVILLYVILQNIFLRLKTISLRTFLSFSLMLFYCVFYWFNSLHYRFFHSWGEMDALKQWEDVLAIWTGVLAISRPIDTIFFFVLPFLLWQFQLNYVLIMKRRITVGMGTIALSLILVHNAFAMRGSTYVQQNPMLFVLRTKLLQYQITHESSHLKTILTPDKIRDFLPINKTLFEWSKNENCPLEKNPLANIAPLLTKVPEHPNVVLVLMESLRAYESGAYGANPSYTPNLDQLAKEGIQFKNFYANGAQTIRGEFAIHSGFIPNNIGTFVYLNNPDLSVKTLPIILKKRGYKTMWIGSHPPTFDKKIKFLSRHGIDEFNYQVPEPFTKIGWGASDEEMFSYAINIFSKQTKPFFAEIMTLSNHFPFSENYPTRDHTPPVTGNPLYQQYVQGMYYTDYAIGKFMEKVKKSPLKDNTIFIFTGDHGIWLYPDDVHTKSMPIRQEIYFRVPGIIWSPSMISPQMVTTLGSHVDIAPTVLDLMNIHETNSFLGTSLLRHDVDKHLVYTLQDNRWNLRADDEYFYDVGPEIFSSHYPQALFDYVMKVKDKEMQHIGFFSSEDLLRTLDKTIFNILPGSRQKELYSQGAGGLAFLHKIIFENKISEKLDGQTAMSEQAKKIDIKK